MRKYDVRLNGKSLMDISQAIQIVDVTESEPKETVKSASFGLADGTRLLGVKRESMAVRVDFMIRDQDMMRRTHSYDRILQWARGCGYLSISDRPEQRLFVERAELPTMGSVKKWTSVLSATFTAYAKPFWESAFSTAASVTTASTVGSALLFAPGNAENCLMEAEITAAGGTVNRLTITTDDSKMSFTGLNLIKGETLRITYTDKGFLEMKIGEKSVMDKRTGESSDELTLTPGKNETVRFEADKACTAVFRTRGRWL